MTYIRKDGLVGVSLALWPSIVEALDKHAYQIGSTRTDIIRRLVVGQLREHRLWPPGVRPVEEVHLVNLPPAKKRGGGGRGTEARDPRAGQPRPDPRGKTMSAAKGGTPMNSRRTR